MNKSLFFFSVNRHQKQYFDSLLNTIKHNDNGISFHKRQLKSIVPSFIFDKYDLDLAYSASDIRIKYFKNKTGRTASRLRAILYFISSMFFLLKVKKLLATNDFDLIVLWNDMKWHQLIIRKLAVRSAIKTAFFENGALPNTVTLDPVGVNFNNSIPRNRSYYEADITNGHDLICSTLTNSLNSYIFVPFQVDYDTQIISHSPWVENMDGLYSTLRNLVRTLPENIKIYVKEHPSSSRCYHHLHDIDNRIEFKNNINTEELINNAELVLTINSTVGLESIIKNKPVIVLGNAFYCIDGLCLHAENEEQLIHQVEKFHYPDSVVLNNFMRFLSKEYYVAGNWRLPEEEHVRAVQARLYSFLGEC